VASQASEAVALPHTTTAGHAMVVLAGQVIDGAVLSFTVMVALQVDVLPQSSVVSPNPGIHNRAGAAWGGAHYSYINCLIASV
jgi:hypothetical protein